MRATLEFNGFRKKNLIIFAKSPITDIWQGYKLFSEENSCSMIFYSRLFSAMKQTSLVNTPIESLESNSSQLYLKLDHAVSWEFCDIFQTNFF